MPLSLILVLESQRKNQRTMQPLEWLPFRGHGCLLHGGPGPRGERGQLSLPSSVLLDSADTEPSAARVAHADS